MKNLSIIFCLSLGLTYSVSAADNDEAKNELITRNEPIRGFQLLKRAVTLQPDKEEMDEYKENILAYQERIRTLLHRKKD